LSSRSRALPYLFSWLKVNRLIRSITRDDWPEDQWRIIRLELRRALEIRSQLRRAGWWN